MGSTRSSRGASGRSCPLSKTAPPSDKEAQAHHRSRAAVPRALVYSLPPPRGCLCLRRGERMVGRGARLQDVLSSPPPRDVMHVDLRIGNAPRELLELVLPHLEEFFVRGEGPMLRTRVASPE